MSYRIYVNNHQLLGNNECPEVLLKELKRQGCEINEEKIFHDFAIKDLDGIVKVLEKYIIDDVGIESANFSDYLSNGIKRKVDLTSHISQIYECGIIFVTSKLLNLIGKENYHIDIKKRKFKYVLNDNIIVTMSGF